MHLGKFGIYFWIFTVLEWLRYNEKVEFWDKFGINIDSYDVLCMLDLIFTVFEWLRCRERRLNLAYIWKISDFGWISDNFGWISDEFSDEFQIKGHVIWMLQSNRLRVLCLSTVSGDLNLDLSNPHSVLGTFQSLLGRYLNANVAV